MSPLFKSLVSLSLLLTLLTVVLSAYIRLAEVGIGCEGWPECYAQLNPEQEQRGVTVLTDKGRDMAHYGARVAHRYIASALGIFILLIVIFAWQQRHKLTSGLSVPIIIFAITVFLSVLGYYTPTRSNPLITMGNLLGGLALLGLLWWLMQREAIVDRSHQAPPSQQYRPLALLALGLIVIQIVLGGWSSANYASVSCPGLFQCEGEWLSVASIQDGFNPARDISLDTQGKVVQTSELGVLSIAHRVFALFTAAYLAWMVRKLKSLPGLFTTTATLSVFSIGQILVGVSMIWLELPLLMLTLHNTLAAGLLVASINLLHQLTPLPVSVPPD